tara:strand:+ start:76 stop:309 length:234 start_codon:yes stop_codon:yes gene_type:complete
MKTCHNDGNERANCACVSPHPTKGILMFRHDPAAMMAAAGALLCAAMIAQATTAHSHPSPDDQPPTMAAALSAEQFR